MKKLFNKQELILLTIGFTLMSIILAVATYGKIKELNSLQNEITIPLPTFNTTITPNNSNFLLVTAKDIKNKITSKEDFVLVDARSPEDFNEIHIEGAVNIPLVDIIDKSKDLSKNKSLVVMCYSQGCQSADKAADKLSDIGFTNITIFREGMEGWTNAGYPTVSGE